MGQVAEDMITGICCAMCGEFLMCDECADLGIPMYCSKQCAKDAGEDPKHRVCNHKKTYAD